MVKRSLIIIVTAFLLIGGSVMAVNAWMTDESMYVDETGWAFYAELNEELMQQFSEEDVMYRQALEEKVDYDFSDQYGAIEVVLTEVRREEGNPHILIGEGHAYFQTNDFIFETDFDDVQVYQIEGEEGPIRGMSIDGEFTTAEGELDMLSFNTYWSPETGKVYAVGSVGFVTNYGMLAFGDPFVDQDDFSEENLIEFE
ncbi:hypothetical protein J2R98_000053 [Alkalibacillus filiformis]|uniref:Uncharacterized protein n=1 Tax=Alkalibacillus filiformis TaxID=200990 RepID=A0ABU0DP88_9BACI|nr:hypothetical protein [Alkalibacillus filiformis]MDQ0350250.1 hypothetical protein [Alkalibacillus filiformis]